MLIKLILSKAKYSIQIWCPQEEKKDFSTAVYTLELWKFKKYKSDGISTVLDTTGIESVTFRIEHLCIWCKADVITNYTICPIFIYFVVHFHYEEESGHTPFLPHTTDYSLNTFCLNLLLSDLGGSVRRTFSLLFPNNAPHNKKPYSAKIPNKLPSLDLIPYLLIVASQYPHQIELIFLSDKTSLV